MTMTHLISKQWLKIESPIINTNNQLNEVFSSFDSLNKEISPGFHLIDIFSNYFSFISVNQKALKLQSLIRTDLTIFIKIFLPIMKLYS